MSAVPESATMFFHGAVEQGTAEFPVGNIQQVVLVGPTSPNSFAVAYAAPIQSATLESWPAIGDAFGATTNYSSRPTPQDWIVSLPTQDLPAFEIATAMVASRCGYPVWITVEIQGAYHSASSPPDSPPRICCRLFQGRAIYGSDGHQTAMPPAIMAPLLTTSIQLQNQNFMAAMSAASRTIYSNFFAWLQGPEGEPFRLSAPKPDDQAYENACSPIVTIIAFGGFAADGGSVSWPVRDCLPMSLHLLKHRLRAGQGRAVCHQDHCPMPSLPPKMTMEASYDANVLADIRAVRAHDAALHAGWEMHIRNAGLLPINVVSTVMDYFSRANI